MKPIMQFRHGIWYCHIRSANATNFGVGTTMEEAYHDWQVKTNHPALARAEEARILKIIREYAADVSVRTNTSSTTCPECNMAVMDNICINRHCNYCGPGWTLAQREKAWRNHGTEERTTGAQYNHTGRE